MANAKELKEKLFSKKKNGLLTDARDCYDEAIEFCEGYKDFLNQGKTERECTAYAIEAAKAAGFCEFECGKQYFPGDKVYYNNRDKSVALAVIGKEPVENGTLISVAHIDSPRLDAKQNPLYEDCDIALFKTHYYGGIKKYQWAAVPLSLHGVICKSDGEKITVCIGEKADEPKFMINDLLPHLASEQSKRTLSDGIRGEELNVMVGSMPFKDDSESELIKLNILSVLFEKYGIVEDDLLSAELEFVPAFSACDIGFDRSLIGSYGHDDRVCGYTALQAILDTDNPTHTLVCVLADKEETGSNGVTGMKSNFLRFVISSLAKMQNGCAEKAVMSSKCLSADVSAAVDPTFQDVYEKKNAAFINHGVCILKFSGARGKSGSSDASAEYCGWVRSVMDKAGVVWQMAELGKVDIGGGGTVANYIANMGIDTVDIGVPVLSMHAPFEACSKFDLYMTYKAFSEFNRQ